MGGCGYGMGSWERGSRWGGALVEGKRVYGGVQGFV